MANRPPRQGSHSSLFFNRLPHKCHINIPNVLLAPKIHQCLPRHAGEPLRTLLPNLRYCSITHRVGNTPPSLLLSTPSTLLHPIAHLFIQWVGYTDYSKCMRFVFLGIIGAKASQSQISQVICERTPGSILNVNTGTWVKDVSSSPRAALSAKITFSPFAPIGCFRFSTPQTYIPWASTS